MILLKIFCKAIKVFGISVNKKCVLVTGGAGYIGSHCCKLLAQSGYKVIVYDNLVYGHKDFVKWGELEVGDVCDRKRLEVVFKKYNPSSVMHFAAYAYVGESVLNPGKYYRNNVLGSLTLLEVMRDFEVKNIVFSSTCATYGIPKEIPIPESHDQNPISPYGMSKIFVEKILQDFDRAHGIKSVSLRYFNASGADKDSEIGEDHNPETHLIPLLLDVASGKKEMAAIFGDDYETHDGTCVRDYIHVEDLSKAHVLALEYLKEKNQSDFFNLGNEKGFSVLEVVKSVERVTCKVLKKEFVDRREGDPAILIGSSEKAKLVLGWQPKNKEIDVIVEDAWKWHQSSPRLRLTGAKRFGARTVRTTLRQAQGER